MCKEEKRRTIEHMERENLTRKGLDWSVSYITEGDKEQNWKRNTQKKKKKHKKK